LNIFQKFAIGVVALILIGFLVGVRAVALIEYPIPDIPFDSVFEIDYQPPFIQPLPGQRRDVIYNSTDTENREYTLYLPSTLVPGEPAPLIFSYHGFGSTPRQQELLCFFSILAEEHRFIVVYPKGIGRSHNSGPSCCPPAYPDTDDVANAKVIIENVNSNFHPVNRSRIYATGMSNGGYMSTRLACDAADVFAAVASVTGANPWPNFLGNCRPSRAIPYLHFHGTADPTVDYSNAELTVNGFLTLNGCNPNIFTQVYNNGDSTCVAYTSGCLPNSGQGLMNVTFCTVDGGLHAWPGNPVYQQGTLDLDASPHIIDFFLRYTLQ